VIICLRFEFQIRPTRFAINFLFITARTERKVRLFVTLFDFLPRYTHPFDLKFACFFFQIQSRFLHEISTKKIFRESFSEILCKPMLSSKKICEILPYFMQFDFGSILR